MSANDWENENTLVLTVKHAVANKGLLGMTLAVEFKCGCIVVSPNESTLGTSRLLFMDKAQVQH